MMHILSAAVFIAEEDTPSSDLRISESNVLRYQEKSLLH